jgi:hypothetical protein
VERLLSAAIIDLILGIASMTVLYHCQSLGPVHYCQLCQTGGLTIMQPCRMAGLCLVLPVLMYGPFLATAKHIDGCVSALLA